MGVNASSKLAPRAIPKQERARRTIDRLLTTTAQLLAEVGVDAFNTNLLAQAAEVGPRAIYRYFPNKWAILRALAERYQVLELEWMGDLARFAETTDWERLVDKSIDDYYQAARREPGFAALQSASRASPELREFEDAGSALVVQQLAIGLRGLGLSCSEAELLALCRVIIESVNRTVDICLGSDEAEAQQLQSQLKIMIRQLVAYHLSGKRTD